jgi:hypothetical protein
MRLRKFPFLFLRLGRERQRIALAAARVRRFGCLGFGDILRLDGDDAALVGHDQHAQSLVLAHRLEDRGDETRSCRVNQHEPARSTLIPFLIFNLMLSLLHRRLPAVYRPPKLTEVFAINPCPEDPAA